VTETVAQEPQVPQVATTIAATEAVTHPPAAVTTSTSAVDTAPQPKVANEPVPSEPAPVPGEPAPRVPTTLSSRLITGFAAAFLPRMLGESLGLIHVGGGRGLWIFAEADTLVLDLVVLYAIVFCMRGLWRRRVKLTATFVFCLLLFVMTAGPMLYTVNNFGTLFRLRLMVFCIAAILPITLRATGETQP
jgi:hypothetical protein